MAHIRWTVLGSGGGEAVPGRASAGHLLETPRTTVLFDCGDGVTGSFLRAGKRFEDVDAIFISHTHPDHICGLAFFVQQMYLAVRRRELVVYLPEEAIAGITSYLTLNYLFVERFPFPIEFLPLHDGLTLSCGDAGITPHTATHLTRLYGQPWMADPEHRGESYSFEIHWAGRKIAYSGDVGALDDLGFCADADLLVAEATHIPLPGLLERAEDWRVKALVVSHIGPEFDETNLAVLAKRFSGKVFVAADGLAVPLAIGRPDTHI